jgi:hypothetical protein
MTGVEFAQQVLLETPKSDAAAASRHAFETASSKPVKSEQFQRIAHGRKAAG